MSRVNQRDGTVPCKGPQLIEEIAVLVYLPRIAAAKLIPPGGIMAEPLAKLGAGRDVLHPLVDGGKFLSDPTWPQPVD